MANRTSSAIYHQRSHATPKPSTLDPSVHAMAKTLPVQLRPADEWFVIEQPLLKDLLGDEILRTLAIDGQDRYWQHAADPDRVKRGKSKHKTSDYLLSGILHAKQDDGPLVGVLCGRVGKKVRYYRHRRGRTGYQIGSVFNKVINAAMVEKAVLDAVKDTLTNTSDLRQKLIAIIEAETRAQSAVGVDIEDLKRQRERLKKRTELIVANLDEDSDVNTYNFGSLAGNATGNINGHYLNNFAFQVIQVGALNTNTTFAGVIQDNSAGTAKIGNEVATSNVLSLIKVGNGTLTLTGSNTYSGGAAVQGGTLVVKYSSSTASAAKPLLSGSTATDIKNGAVVFDNTGDTSPAATIRGLLQSSYTNGSGVMNTGQLSSRAATTSRGLGYADDGVSQVKVLSTLFGDADLDGGVSINDFNLLAANFGKVTPTASDNPNSTPNYAALGLWSFAVEHNDQAGFIAATSVPEPASLGLMTACVTLGLRRRRV